MTLERRNIACHVFAIVVGMLVTVTGYNLLDRGPVVTLDSLKSSVYPNPAKMGQTIAITWSAVPHRNCSGYVIPRVIDSSGRIYEYARLATVYQNLMRPDERYFTKTLTLPPSMAAGPARYEAVVVRWCNRVQEYFWPMVDAPYPIPFDIAP